jgi:hypothetical protein
VSVTRLVARNDVPARESTSQRMARPVDANAEQRQSVARKRRERCSLATTQLPDRSAQEKARPSIISRTVLAPLGELSGSLGAIQLYRAIFPCRETAWSLRGTKRDARPLSERAARNLSWTRRPATDRGVGNDTRISGLSPHATLSGAWFSIAAQSQNPAMISRRDQ